MYNIIMVAVEKDSHHVKDLFCKIEWRSVQASFSVIILNWIVLEVLFIHILA